MPLAVDVVKRYGRRPIEKFDESKLKQSIYAACLSIKTPVGEADSTSNAVVRAVIVWVGARPTVTSSDIRRVTSTHLERFHPDAAYIYQHQKSIL